MSSQLPEFARRIRPWGDALRIELTYADGRAPILPSANERPKIGPFRLLALMVRALLGRKF